MQIRVEVEVTPEELRRFLGLPDVAGLQEDVIAFLRDKVGAASEFDAAGFVKSNFKALKKNEALGKIIARLRVRPPEKPEKKKTARAAPRKRAARKPRKTAAAPASAPAAAPQGDDSSS